MKGQAAATFADPDGLCSKAAAATSAVNTDFLIGYGVQAYAAARMAESVLLGLDGNDDIWECAFVESSVTKLPFFASKVCLINRISRIIISRNAGFKAVLLSCIPCQLKDISGQPAATAESIAAKGHKVSKQCANDVC